MSSTPPEANEGFFSSLFDLSFTRFVTARVVSVLYVLMLIILVLVYVIFAISFFSSGRTGLGVAWLLILGPLFLLLYTLLYRVIFELLVVIFRIYENTRDQLELTRRATTSAPPPVPPEA
jgi:Domain of unknown function (DUF4282)